MAAITEGQLAHQLRQILASTRTPISQADGNYFRMMLGEVSPDLRAAERMIELGIITRAYYEAMWETPQNS